MARNPVVWTTYSQIVNNNVIPYILKTKKKGIFMRLFLSILTEVLCLASKSRPSDPNPNPNPMPAMTARMLIWVRR